MIALDVSKSMRCQDLGTSRLDFAKRSIQRLVSQTHGDRLGLVVFAGDAFIECPLTTDLNAIELFLRQISPEMIQKQGTAVGRAIQTCIEGFDESNNTAKVVLVLTDGENHEDDIVAASREAKTNGVSVHFLGCGTPRGGLIPDFDSTGDQIGYLQDANGKTVVSKLDHQILLESAQSGGGIYIPPSNSPDVLKPFINFKDDLEKSSMATVKFVDFDHQFMPWLMVALCLLLAETLLPRRKRPTMNFSNAVLLVLLFSHGFLATGQTHAAEQFERGAQALANGQYEEAASFYASVEDDLSFGPRASYNKGCILYEEEVEHARSQTDSTSIDRFSLALGAFKKVIASTEDLDLLEDAHFNASLSAMQLQQPLEAIERAKSTLRINPSHDDARMTMALAKRMMEQQEMQKQQQDGQQQDGQQQDGQQQDGQQQDGQQQDGQQQDGQQQDGQQQDGQQKKGQQQDRTTTGRATTGRTTTGRTTTGRATTRRTATGRATTGRTTKRRATTGRATTGRTTTGWATTGRTTTGRATKRRATTGRTTTGRDNNRTDNKRTDNNRTGNNKTDNNRTGNNRTDNKRKDNNRTGNNRTDNNRMGNNRTDNNRTGNKKKGQQQDGQQQDGQQQEGQQQDGQQQDGQQQDGQQQDGQQQDGQQQEGQQQDGQPQDGQQSYKMSPEYMERILEGIERQEADVQAKIRATQTKKNRIKNSTGNDW